MPSCADVNCTHPDCDTGWILQDEKGGDISECPGCPRARIPDLTAEAGALLNQLRVLRWHLMHGDVTQGLLRLLEKRGAARRGVLSCFVRRKCSARGKLVSRMAHEGESYDRRTVDGPAV